MPVRSRTIDQKHLRDIISLTDSTTGTASDTLAAATNIALLVDSAGGTQDNTVSPTVAIADTDMTPIGGSGMTTAQEAVYDVMVGEVNVALGIVNDNFGELTEEAIAQRALNIVLINALASLATKFNEILTDMRRNP